VPLRKKKTQNVPIRSDSTVELIKDEVFPNDTCPWSTGLVKNEAFPEVTHAFSPLPELPKENESKDDEVDYLVPVAGFGCTTRLQKNTILSNTK